MASLLDDLRKDYSWTKGKSDADIVFSVSKATGHSPDFIAEQYGLKPADYQQNQPGFTTSLKSSLYGIPGGVGQLMQDTGVPGGQAVQEFGDLGQYRNPVTVFDGSGSAISNLGNNLVEHPLDTMGQIAGQAAGLMIPVGVGKVGLGAYRAVRGLEAATELAAPSLAARAGGMAAEGTYYGLPQYEQTRQAQIAGGHGDDPGAIPLALGTSFASGLVEGEFGPQSILARGKLAPFVEGPGKTMLRTAGKAGLAEAGEELVQNPLQAIGSYQDPMSKDNLDQTGAQAIAAFLGGGVLGGAMHPLMRRQQMAGAGEVDLTQRTDPNAPPPAPLTAEGVVGQNTVQPGLNLQDFINQQQGIGGGLSVPRADVQAAFNEKLDVPQVITGPDGKGRTTDSAADAYLANNGQLVPPAQDAQAPTVSPLAAARAAATANGVSPKAWATFVSKNELREADADTIAAAIRDKAQRPSTKLTEPWEAAHAAVTGTSITDYLNQEQAHGSQNTVQAGPVGPAQIQEQQAGKIGVGQGQEGGVQGAPVQVGQAQVAPVTSVPAPAVASPTPAAAGGAFSTSAPALPLPTATPAEVQDYRAKLKNFLLGVLSPQDQEVLKKAGGANLNREMTADELLKMRELLMQERLKKTGKPANAGDHAIVDSQLAAITDKGDKEGAGSLRAVAADMGVSHQTVKNRLAKANGILEAAARHAGVPLDVAKQTLDLQSEDALDIAPVSEAAVAQMGGMSYRRDGVRHAANQTESDDFSHEAGYDRNESVDHAISATSDGSIESSDAADVSVDHSDMEEGLDDIALEAAAEGMDTDAAMEGVRPSATGLTVEDAAKEWEDSRIKAHGDPAWDALTTAQKQQWTNMYFRWDEGVNGTSDALLEKGRKGIAHAAIGQREENVEGDGRATGEAGSETSASSAADANQQDTAQQPAAGAEEGTGETAHPARQVALNPIEARVAELRPKLGEAQTKRLDKILARYKSGDIDLDRLTTELDTLDQQAFAPENGGKGIQYSEGKAERGQPAAGLAAFLRKLMVNPALFDRRVTVVQSESEVPAKYRGSESNSKSTRLGFYDPNSGHMWLIADNIPKGREFSVFLHEAGVHMGMKNLLGKANYDRLVAQIKTWAAGEGAIEHEIAKDALSRIEDAEKGSGGMTEAAKNDELIAYFVEEAVRRGINPSALASQPKSMQAWFSTLWNAVKAAVQKLGLNPATLKAVDVVDLAYGAARLELNGSFTDQEAANDATGRPMGEPLYNSGEVKNSVSSAKPRQWELNWARNAVEDAAARVSEGEAKVRELRAEHVGETLARGNTTGSTRIADVMVEAAKGRVELEQKFLDEAKADLVDKQAKLADLEARAAGLLNSIDSTADRIDRNVSRIARQAAQDAATNNWDRVKKFGLGWLSLSQLREVSGRISKELGAAVTGFKRATDAIQTESKHWIDRAAKVDRMWSTIKDQGTLDRLSDVMRAARRMGYDPQFEDPQDAQQEALQRQFNALPSTAQQVYISARDHYKATMAERNIFMQGAIERAYAERIKDATESGDKKRLKQLEAAKGRAERDWNDMAKQAKGPYFPLMRLGSWYSVGMSKELSDLTDKLNDGEASKAEKDRIAVLRQDPSHYVTQSHESKADAKRATEALGNKYATARFNESRQFHRETMSLSASSLEEVSHYISTEFDSQTRAAIHDMMAELYFNSLPEHHALKRQLRAEMIHGEDTNMRRVFAKSTVSEAHYVANLKHLESVREALQKVREEGKRSHDARQVENVVDRHIALSMSPQNTSPVVSALVNASYFAHLGASPAFWLTNATQVPMIALPWLAARHGGLARATGAIRQAYVDSYRMVKASYKDQGINARLDWSSLQNEGERSMLNTLLERNLLDVTIEHDMRAVADGSHTKMTEFMRHMSLPVHATELMNRSVTALAAYRLSKNKGMTDAAAVEHAIKAVEETQFDYSALNAPLYMKSVMGSKALARVVMQFRKYQQAMLWLVGRSMYDAVKGQDAETRNMARGTLTYLALTSGTMAGALGLPLMGSVAFVANMVASIFGPPDDKWDFETWLRNTLTDTMGPEAALAFAKGIPAAFGVDMSKRVGMQDIASPLPFIRQGKSGDAASQVGNTLAALGGAPVGTLTDMVDGMNYFSDGQWTKGLEKIAPLKAAKDMLRAYRYSSDGLTSKNGTPMMGPEQFDPWDLALRATGFSPTTETEHYAAQSAMMDAKTAATDVRTRLLRDYAIARGGNGDLSGVEDQIADFNDRHPDKGVRITYSNKLSAVRSRDKQAKELNGQGVRVGKNDSSFMEQARFAEDE